MQLVKVNPKEFGIEEEKANQMVSGLAPIIAEREILAAQYSGIIKKELIPATLKEARELRIRIRDNRTKGVEKWHKANKEFYLAGGRFVDAIKNKEVAENIRMEDALEQIEKHFENLEKQRIADLQKEREAMLSPFNVENLSALNLGVMDGEVFNGFMLGAKIRHEQRLEAERLAAQKAFEAQQEALRKENEAIISKANAEREAAENAARIERQKAEAERLRLESELKAKKDAEEKAERERLAEIEMKRKEAEKLSKAPIKKQLKVWVDSFSLPATEVDNATAKEIQLKFTAFKLWAVSQIELM